MAKRKHGNTGCAFLDEHGVGQSDGYGYTLLCTEQCPYPSCVLDRNKAIEAAVEEEDAQLVDVTLSCAFCHTLETITFADGKINRHPRFVVDGDLIYHLTISGERCGHCKVLGKELVK